MVMKYLGYYKDYFVGTKYMGQESCEKDRDIMGYNGKTKHIAEKTFKIGKKTIKEGTEYITMVYPLCGR
jgi:hypothetical protein